MSAPDFSRAHRSGDWPSRFSAWRGLASLAIGLVAGPLVALINQQLVYASDMWVCGHGYQRSLHIIPVLGLIIVAAVTWRAHSNWTAVGGGAGDEDDSIATRTRFLALLGMTISAFSALVILAQWLGIFIFGACVRV